jgi:hypothetical protein
VKKAIRFPLLVLVSAAVVGLVPLPAAAQGVPNVDLAIVANTANIEHGHVGQQVTFAILATNNGPDSAPSLDVYDNSALQGLQIVAEICDLGISPDTPACEYHDVLPGQTLTTTVVAKIISTGNKIASLTSCVQSEQIINDPNIGNDCGTATLKVVGKRSTKTLVPSIRAANSSPNPRLWTLAYGAMLKSARRPAVHASSWRAILSQHPGLPGVVPALLPHGRLLPAGSDVDPHAPRPAAP